MEPPQYYVVAFHNKELPVDFNFKNGDEVVRRVAKEKFGLTDADFNPKPTGHVGGSDGKGYVMEIELKAYSAHLLEKKHHPDVMAVFEPLPPPDYHFGARDPKDLPKKKFSGPKP